EQQAPLADSSGGFNKVEADCNTSREQQAPLADSGASPSIPSEPQASPIQQQASFTAPVQQAEAAQAVETAPAAEAPAPQQEGGDGLFGDDSFEIQEESVPDIF
ncbi:MAG: hypothetical protein IJL24_01410, partial [Treponema sp.]|nr:hypothetical protein [Treponema sp.]